MYAQGIGVERDPALAAKYLAVVAQVRNYPMLVSNKMALENDLLPCIR